MRKLKLSKHHFSKFFAIIFFVLLLGAYVRIFAIGSPYSPGDTLDPACPPGEINCTVEIASSPITVINSSSLFSTGIVGAGQGATLVEYSNFFGFDAGNGATSADYSNFFGANAGKSSTNAHDSNFLGLSSGNLAVNAFYSNFLGRSSGSSATNASYSNFIGYRAGDTAANATNSIFIGQNSGLNDTVNNTSNGLSSILLGSFTNTGGFSNSVLIGSGTTGVGIANTKANQFMLAPTLTEMRLRGVDYTLPSSQGGANTYLSNNGSGVLSWGTISSANNISGGLGGQILYQSAVDTTAKLANGLSGQILTSAGTTLAPTWATPPITIVNTSNLFSTGVSAGTLVTTATFSNFLGSDAGDQATSASNSNFIGRLAGRLSTSASSSNFFGQSAGASAPNAFESNFFGYQAGYQATDSSNSNFIGNAAGQGATTAPNSNFIGYHAGFNAVSSNFSNFIGYRAGETAATAYNSVFIGQDAGRNDTVNNTSDPNNFSILIGPVTRTGGFSNSIALGGFAINTASNQLMIGSITRPINTTIFQGAANECTITTGTGIACTSDERLKTNISDLPSNILDKLVQIRTVNFNWLTGDVDSSNIGFIAQDLEDYFPELVTTNTDGYKSVYYASMTPILTEAIRELNLKVEILSSLDFVESNSFGNLIRNYLSNVDNALEIVFFGEVRTKKLCLEDVCIDKNQLEYLLNNINSENDFNSNENAEGGQTGEENPDGEVADDINISDTEEVKNFINSDKPSVNVDNSSVFEIKNIDEINNEENEKDLENTILDDLSS